MPTQVAKTYHSLLRVTHSHIYTSNRVNSTVPQCQACDRCIHLRCCWRPDSVHRQPNICYAPRPVAPPYCWVASCIRHRFQTTLCSDRSNYNHGHRRHSAELLYSAPPHQGYRSQSPIIRLDVSRHYRHTTSPNNYIVASHPVLATRSLWCRPPTYKGYCTACQHYATSHRRVVQMREYLGTTSSPIATAPRLSRQRSILHLQLLRRDPDSLDVCDLARRSALPHSQWC